MVNLIILYGLGIGLSFGLPQVFECFDASDNGCITWQGANSPYAKYYENHKYCRNPLPDQLSKPYCYTGLNSAYILCDDVKECGAVFECFNSSDKGASYLGKVTRPACITWQEANSPYAKYYEDHKYCRNPLPDELPKPYCYTGPNSAFELCDVKKCGEDCSTNKDDMMSACDVLVTCKPPESSPGLSWNPDRTLFYNGDKLDFDCSEAGKLPSVLSTTCLSNGQLEHHDIKCTSAVFECFNSNDKGASYLGKVTRPACITWQEANSPYAKYYEDHKYCRNPLPDELPKPYCYTGPNSAFELCDVKQCGTDCATEHTEGKTNCEVLVTCQPPGTETYPDVILSLNRTLYYVDEKIDFECPEKGYIPSVNYTKCLQNGSFEQLAVKCDGIQCTNFPSIQSMVPINTSTQYRFPDYVNITCQMGYQKIGPEVVNCTHTGLWSQLPNCTGVPCNLLNKVENSVNNHTLQHRYPESVTIICDIGYIINGSDKLNCTSEGEWDRQLPTCLGIECPQSVIQDFKLPNDTHPPFRYPTSLSLACRPGYILNDTDKVNCTHHGNWSTLPQCTAKPCPVLLRIENSLNNHTQQYRYPNSVKLACESGYTINGSDELVCTSEGEWNNPLPTCIGMECPANQIQHLNVLNNTQAPYRYPSFVKIECKEGHLLSYNSTLIQCDYTGKWSVLPQCEASEDRSESSLTTGQVAGGISAVVAVVIIIAALFVIYRRRRPEGSKENRFGTPSKRQESNVYANSQVNKGGINVDSRNDDHTYYNFDDTIISKTAVKMDTFPEFVENGKSNKGEIEVQFGLLETGIVKPTTAAQLPGNTKKNKYRNIYPYDETRVVLDKIADSPNSDYINASFINGFGKIKQYIASQGPLGPTVDDWWRMVWQYNCGKVVMLTRVFEMGKEKCVQYWPDLEQKSIKFGSIEISITSEDVYSDFTVRTLQLVQDKKKKLVEQFHFTAWPDKDVPKYASSLVYFQHKVNNTKSIQSGPLLVHCSAGIGRTGTFIALDYAVTEANQLGHVDVFRCVEILRRQRPNMVQTSKQYVFLHEAVLEALMYTTSGIPTAEFVNIFRQLMESKEGQMQLEQEYEMMTNMGYKHDEKVFEAGKAVENRTKNRYNNILPVKSETPVLSTTAEGHNEYINAVFLPGYTNNRTFIITQMPLEGTIIDLWRLVWDYNIKEIVMMNQSYEQKEVYWPDTDNASFSLGPFTVTLKEHDKQKVLSRKKLILTYKSQEQREVKLRQSSFWPDEALIPSSVDDLIYFLTDLQHEHGNHDESPVLVHCLNGCDKSGLYCVMATVIERLRIEQDVDIQHTIKQMRNRRPQIIPNFEQYRFLHEAVVTYLEQFEAYSNFQ